jgi:hypothetical protein
MTIQEEGAEELVSGVAGDCWRKVVAIGKQLAGSGWARITKHGEEGR